MIKHIIIVTLIVLFGSSRALSAEQVCAISYHTFISPPMVREVGDESRVLSDKKILYLSLYIKNTGDGEIRVPTRVPVDIAINEGRVSIKLFLGKKKNNVAIETVVPESEMGIVVLKHGEVAVVEVRDVVGVKEDDCAVDIIYSIDKGIAKRYELFSETILVKSKLINSTISRTNRDVSEPFWFDGNGTNRADG